MAQNTYSFKLKNGKTLDVNGPEPPSDEEIEGIANEAGVELALADAPDNTPVAPVNTPIAPPQQQVIGAPPAAPQKPNIEAPPSMLEKGYRMLMDAPEFITAPAKRFSDLVTTPRLDDSPLMAQTKGFVGGAAEGIASQFSPANILTQGRSRLANIAARALGGTQIAHGGHELYEGNTAEGLGDIGWGLLSMISGMDHSTPKGGPNIPPPDVPIRPNGPSLPPDNMNQAAILEAIKAPIVNHPRPEGVWDNNLGQSTPAPSAGITPDKMFEIARQNKGMGEPLPEGMDQISGPIKEAPAVDLEAERQRFYELAAKEQAGNISPREAAEGRALHIRLQEAGGLENGPQPKVETPHPNTEKDAINQAFERGEINEEVRDALIIQDDRRLASEQARRESTIKEPASTSANRGKVQDADLAEVEATYNSLKDSKIPEEREAAKLLKGVIDSKKQQFPSLPRELKGAQPRYSSGKNMYEPTFKSDMDKALYIIAQKNPSLHDASYLKFVMDNTGLDEAGARAAGNVIKGRIKEFLKTQKSGKVNIEPMFKLTEDMVSAKAPIEKGLSREEIRMQALAEARARMDTNATGFREAEAYNPANDVSDLPINQIEDLMPPPAPPLLSPIEGGGSGGNKPPRSAGSGGGRPPNNPKGEPIIRRIKERTPEQAPLIEELWNTTKGTMAVDLPFVTSAGFRQALPLAGTKEWFKAWMPSMKSYWSKELYDAHVAMLKADPLAQRPLAPMMDKKTGEPRFKNGHPVMTEMPSIFDRAGVKFADLGSLSSREETIRSTLAEKIPVWGKVIARSNRAYVAYINDLRASAFRNFYEAMPDKNNDVQLKELGELVNVLTGRGSLTMEIPREIGLPGGSMLGPLGKGINLEKVPVLGQLAGKKADLEGLSRTAANILWAPKLIASRLKMLNPTNYMTGSPLARKQYLLGALRTAGAYTTFATLAHQFLGADISFDPNNADFLKIKKGNTRIDPLGGFQQFVVLASRLASQSITSSTTGKVTPFNSTPFSSTTGDSIEEFITNKLHPRAKQLWDASHAKNTRQYNVMDRELQQWIPMLIPDLVEIAKDEPELVPMIGKLLMYGLPTSAGMGLQNYEGKDFNNPVITPWIPEKFRPNEITLGKR